MLLKYYHKTSFFVSYWYVSKSKKVLHQKTSKILPTTVSIKTKMMGMLHKAFVRRESDPLGTKQCGSHFVVVVLFFWKMGQLRSLLFIFVFSTCQNFMKAIWCAWDSNPWRQDGSRRRLHSAMTATPSYYFKRLKLVNRCELN